MAKMLVRAPLESLKSRIQGPTSNSLGWWTHGTLRWRVSWYKQNTIQAWWDWGMILGSVTPGLATTRWSQRVQQKLYWAVELQLWYVVIVHWAIENFFNTHQICPWITSFSSPKNRVIGIMQMWWLLFAVNAMKWRLCYFVICFQ